MTISIISTRPRNARRNLLLAVLAVLLATPFSAHAMRIAYGDVPSIESLNLLIALERARERGVDIQLSYFDSEGIAAQAVVGGQADIGVGAPYSLIQNVRLPVRFFCQMSTLRFFPVVNSDKYKTWEDLAGERITVHSRGSGTEALVKLMAKKHDFEYSNISYIPGSAVRAGAMLKGRIDATIVDAAAWRMLQERGDGKFKRLPISGVNATDEALYATQEFLKNNQQDVQILIEELLRTWRDIDQNPAVVSKLRDKYNLLPDLPQEMEDDVVPFYKASVENSVFPTDGGRPAEVKSDIAFYTKADTEDVKVSDYWNFMPLQRARSALAEQ